MKSVTLSKIYVWVLKIFIKSINLYQGYSSRTFIYSFNSLAWALHTSTFFKPLCATFYGHTLLVSTVTTRIVRGVSFFSPISAGNRAWESLKLETTLKHKAGSYFIHDGNGVCSPALQCVTTIDFLLSIFKKESVAHVASFLNLHLCIRIQE